MRILLTNDDGIDAEGLKTLESVLDEMNVGWTTVAPAQPLSGCSHQVTTERPLQLFPVAPQRYAVSGTPADCVRIAMLHLEVEADWVLAGINDGGNLGVDIYMSGTVAAAREAVLLGRPAIALSQFRRYREGLDWQQSGREVRFVLEALLEQTNEEGHFWNVNLPDERPPRTPPVLKICPLDRNPLPVNYDRLEEGLYYRGNYQQRPRTPDHDVDVCFRGHVSITSLPV